MNNWILFMQIFLILAGAISLVMGIKFTVPMAVNEVLVIWSIILSLLKPPYLHILINGIIITIAAASRFLQNPSEPPPVQPQRLISAKTPPPAYYAAFSAPPEVKTIFEVPEAAAAAADGGDRVVELKPVIVNGFEVDDSETEEETVADHSEAQAEDEDVFVDRALTYNRPSPERISPEFQLEYVVPGKPVGNVHERVRAAAPPTEESLETLESAWMKIREGASRATSQAQQEVRYVEAARRLSGRNAAKSKSFKRGTIDDDSPPGRASSGIQKELSPSQDELNRRVEAFIKKVNNEIRLRREESLNQSMEIINSGT